MMKLKWAFLFIACVPCLFCCQAKLIPSHRIIDHQIGEDIVKINLYQYGTSNQLVFLNLHANETTSVDAAREVLASEEGLLITIENKTKRNITFRLNNETYSFDPNRIFSRVGIRRTLDMFERKSEAAEEAVENFAARLLSLLPKEPACLIALHNNTEGGLAIHSFMKGGRYEKDAKDLYVNKEEDPDDFFLTTDIVLFNELAAAKYNIVLQDNENADQDGSLSVYCGEKNIRYLNCETQHGNLQQHTRMLRRALRVVAVKRAE